MFAGAKGSSSSFKQTPDNLRSNDTFEGVLGLCIGGIKGPTRGLKSIKVDGTAIENETGEQNLQDFTATLGDGDPLKFPQKVQLKLGAGASPMQIGLSLPNENGNNPVWITKTIANTGADFLDFRFIVQQLFRQDAKGIYTATATIEIQMKPVGSTTWINPTITAGNTGTDFFNADGTKTYVPSAYGVDQNTTQNYAITGKTSSAAVYELRIGVPNEGAYADTAWDVRCRLLERETYTGGTDGSDQEKRTISWESLAAVYAGVMGDHEDWRGVAWLQLYGKASDQLTGVPEITGEYDTKIIAVPSSNVYNPDTRTYTPGVWDGSWVKAYTNDPAWVINDAISDELSGISLIARGSYLNKWDALDLSKHCCERVPDGNGGTEPRYNMNIAISQPQKAEEFIRYLAGAVGALAWDQGNGEWRVKVDKADAPSDIFTLDNIEGEFVYSHTDVDTRFNDIIGQFKNAEMDYRADAVHLYDNASIALLGRKPTTIALVGCTSRQEAMRRVKLRIRSTVNENRIVTFTTNRRGRNIEQLSTILIADGDLGDQDKRTTGRTVAVAPDRTSIVVRDPMYLAPGIAYKMWFTVPNPSYNPDVAGQPSDANWTKPTLSIYRNVVNTSGQRGSVTTVYLDTALPDTIADNLAIALEATDLPTMPRLFRVTSVMPGDDGERVSISAINIDTGKWAASDNVSKEDTVFQDLRGAVPPPRLPQSGRVLSLIKVPVEQGNSVNLVATWVRPSGAFINGFTVKYSINGGALKTAVEKTQETTFEWVNPVAGIYHVEVVTNDRRGGVSVPLTDTYEVTQEILDAGDIKYTDGQDMESLQPAEPGATNSANPTSPIGTRTVAAVLADLAAANKSLDDARGEVTKLANTQIKDILDRETLRQYADARLFLEGIPLGVVVVENNKRSIAADTVFAQNFLFFGARSGDGMAWILDTDTLRVSPTMSLSERFSSIDTSVGDNETEIQNVSQAVTDLASSTGTNFTLISSRFDTNEATVRDLDTTVVTLTSATASSFEGVATRFGLNETSISNLQQAYSDLNTSTAQSISSLSTRVGVAEGDITSLQTSVSDLNSSLSTSISSITARFGTNEASFTSLQQAFAGPSGGYAKSMQLLDINGNITGTYNTNTGAVSTYSILTNVFRLIDPNNGNAIIPFSYENGVVKMSNVEVDRIKIGAVVGESLLDGAMGKAGLYYNSAELVINSDNNWHDLAVVTMTPAYSKPVKINYSCFARAIADDDSTPVNIRILRQAYGIDTVIWGGTGSLSRTRLEDEGRVISFFSMDASEAGTQATYRVQASKQGTSGGESAGFSSRSLYVEELSRVFFDSFTSTASAPSETPPDPGDGGYDPNPPYHCVDVESLILMADGGLKRAGDLKPNEMVLTQHESTFQWGTFPVEAVSFREEDVFLIKHEGHVLRATKNHKIYMHNRWMLAQNVGIPDGRAMIAKISVAAARTYISNGLLSHNLKADIP